MMKLRLPSRRNVREWVARYGIQECTASCAALIAALFLKPLLLASQFSWTKVAAVYVVIGVDVSVFYLYGLIREWRRSRGTTSVRITRSVREVILEFVVPGAINVMFIRPPLVCFLPLLIGNVAIGIALAQILAGATFYAMVIPIYEWRKHRGAVAPPHPSGGSR